MILTTRVMRTGVVVALTYAMSLLVATCAQAQGRATPTTVPDAPSSSEAVFARWDADHNASLSLEEFKAGLRQVQNANALRALHDNFVAHDTNKNNALDAAEYANLELIKKEGTAAPALSAFDTDKNQGLDFKEYVGMVTALVSAKH